jgi:hypothetical protein
MSDKPSNEQRYYDVLKRIAKGYDSSRRILSTDRYGLEPTEALEYAYDNIKSEALAAIRGKRRPAQ